VGILWVIFNIEAFLAVRIKSSLFYCHNLPSLY